MNRPAFTLSELIMAVGVLSVMTLAMANFSLNTFKVSSEHSQILDNASQTRFLEDQIASKIAQAHYIFPSEITLSLNTNGDSTSIDTTDSIAMLILDENNANYYYLECFYIKNNQIFEFLSDNSKKWSKNIQPYTVFGSESGTSNSIATKISAADSSLEYSLNYENSQSENIFKGQMASATSYDPLALIKGIKWSISRDNKLITIGGVSNNVPRYIE